MKRIAAKGNKLHFFVFTFVCHHLQSVREDKDIREDMPNYIITENGRPKCVAAFEFKGLLWNEKTHRPLVNPEAFAACSDEERRFIDQIKLPPEKSPWELFKQAKNFSFKRIAIKSLFCALAARSFFRDKFFDATQIAEHPLIRRCGVKTPSNLPLPYKLAKGIYEFDSSEIYELSRRPTQLVRLGKTALLKTLIDQEFVDKEFKRALNNPNVPLKEVTDPLSMAAAWYSFKCSSVLPHLVDFFGGEKPFFEFLAKRAAWRKKTVKTELSDLNKLDTPDTKNRAYPVATHSP
ncbi:MAG: hypothetical protein P4M13_08905 [Alphaproteobacteria bacterium]|nr:hypothetical protein [Alphaproteobacteria bacterium]